MRGLRLSLLLLSLAGCAPAPGKPGTSQEKLKVEADLAFTNLSKKAYEKLDIKTQPAVVKDVHERLTLTGWIMAMPGNEVTLTAPAAGYVRLAKGAMLPIPGARVDDKTELLHIKPVLSPAEQIQVNALERGIKGELKKAETTLKIAEIDYVRSKGLHKQGLKTDQDLEQAQKARDHAIEERDAALDKLKLFELADIPIRSPQNGEVLQTYVGVGQYVAAGAPLVAVIDLDPVWIRVPVPEFDAERIDKKEKIYVAWKNQDHDRWKNHDPDRKDKPAYLNAVPTGRVSQVDPLKHTADFWYQLEKTNDVPNVVKDQMVTVRLPIGKMEKATVLPYAAIVFDAHGHSWIYVERPEKDGKHQFERRPVELVGAEGEKVIVRTTLKDGDLGVVTKGASVLFSRDFHKTPLNIEGED
jgi:RND family efflux transporter MFP subunit